MLRLPAATRLLSNNPNTSEEAKEHSRQVLENEFNGGEGGLKATLNNPNVSDEAKQNAKERLDEQDL
ncbi:hypothetical protein ACKAV7_007862 [Fusarium commune]